MRNRGNASQYVAGRVSFDINGYYHAIFGVKNFGKKNNKYAAITYGRLLCAENSSEVAVKIFVQSEDESSPDNKSELIFTSSIHKDFTSQKFCLNCMELVKTIERNNIPHNYARLFTSYSINSAKFSALMNMIDENDISFDLVSYFLFTRIPCNVWVDWNDTQNKNNMSWHTSYVLWSRGITNFDDWVTMKDWPSEWVKEL